MVPYVAQSSVRPLLLIILHILWTFLTGYSEMNSE